MKLIIPLLALFFVTVASSQAVAAAHQAYHPAGKPLTELTFAYFPLAVPVSVLGETMQRDRILKKNLANYGFSLNFKPFAKGSDVLSLINEGKIAGVSFSDMPSIEAASSSDMLIIGFVKQSYSAVVAASGTQIKDLRNKRIGNATGSTSHYALLQALAAAGMTDRDVTLVPMESSAMVSALEKGMIDAFAAWEPTPTAVLKKHPGRFSQISRQNSYSFFLLSGALARSHPDIAREITASLVRAIRWLKKNNANLLMASRWSLDGVHHFTGKVSALNERDIASITHDDLLDIVGAPAIPANFVHDGSLMMKEYEFLKKLGKLPTDSSRQRFEKSFSNNLMREVLAAPAHYGLNRIDYDQ